MEAHARLVSILVVEDEYLVAMELRDLLLDSGYGVLGPVATVAAALALLGSQPPHACVLDVNLRGEHSAPVAQALRDQGVPFLLSSAYNAATLDQYPAFAGATNIGKPAQRDQLRTALAALLPAEQTT